ncbi:hypothetical protein Hanom_Chr09g00813691 [Helianthus anomalus]
MCFNAPRRYSALRFSTLRASCCASRIREVRFVRIVISNARTRRVLTLSFRLNASATTFAFPGWYLISQS